jgi:hypothetical protein
VENYQFNKDMARMTTISSLFKVLIALIEVQRQANLYRSGVTNNKLQIYGICSHMGHILNRILPHSDQLLPSLFFKGEQYPLRPYTPEGVYATRDDYKEFRWGNNEMGNKRMKLLALMIKDLTDYLTHEAV